MLLYLHGSGALHFPRFESDHVPRVGEQIIMGERRFHVIAVRWSLSESPGEDYFELVHIDLAPDADNEDR